MMPAVKHAVLAAILGVAATAAQASSPAAWAELYAKAGAACTKASGLSGAKVRGEPADFQGAVLLVIDGRQPNGMRGAAYCLYDKVTAKIETTPAPVGQQATETKPARATGRTCWTESFRAQLKTPRPIGAACTAKNDEGDSYTGVVRP